MTAQEKKKQGCGKGSWGGGGGGMEKTEADKDQDKKGEGEGPTGGGGGAPRLQRMAPRETRQASGAERKDYGKAAAKTEAAAGGGRQCATEMVGVVGGT